MSYTKAEAENIKANLRKIQSFVKQNYAPRLRQHDSLSVRFGPMKCYPGRWEPEQEFAFGFDSYGAVWFRTGGLVLNFIDEDDGPFSSVFQSWTYAPNLLLHWQQVKRQIEQELDKRDRERAALAAFEV